MSEQSEVSKVPVSRRALLLRINKKLSDKGLAVKAARGRACRFMGSYYAIDLSQNQIAGRRIDVENLARKLGALADWEEMEKPDFSQCRKESITEVVRVGFGDTKLEKRPVDLSEYKRGGAHDLS